MVLDKSLIRQAYLKPELRASILAGIGRVASSDDGPDPGGAMSLIQVVVGIISDRFDGTAQEVHGDDARADAVFKVDGDHESGFEIEARSSGDRYDLTLYPVNNFHPEPLKVKGARWIDAIRITQDRLSTWHQQGSARDLVKSVFDVIRDRFDGVIQRLDGNASTASGYFAVDGATKHGFTITATSSPSGNYRLEVRVIGNPRFDKPVVVVGSMRDVVGKIREEVGVWYDQAAPIRSLNQRGPEAKRKIVSLAEDVIRYVEQDMITRHDEPDVKVSMDVQKALNTTSVTDEGNIYMSFSVRIDGITKRTTTMKKVENVLMRAIARLPQDSYFGYISQNVLSRVNMTISEDRRR